MTDPGGEERGRGQGEAHWSMDQEAKPGDPCQGIAGNRRPEGDPHSRV